MNSHNSNGQFSGFENFQPTTITSSLTPQSNLAENNVPYVTSSMQHQPQPRQTFQPASVNTVVNSQNDLVVYHTVNPIAFFYRPPNDFYNYCIKLKEVLVDIVVQSFNEFSSNVSNGNFNQNVLIFLYQHQINDRI